MGGCSQHAPDGSLWDLKLLLILFFLFCLLLFVVTLIHGNPQRHNSNRWSVQASLSFKKFFRLRVLEQPEQVASVSVSWLMTMAKLKPVLPPRDVYVMISNKRVDTKNIGFFNENNKTTTTTTTNKLLHSLSPLFVYFYFFFIYFFKPPPFFVSPNQHFARQPHLPQQGHRPPYN